MAVNSFLLFFFFPKLCLMFAEFLINRKMDFLGDVPVLLHLCSALGYDNCGGRYCLMMTNMLSYFQE